MNFTSPYYIDLNLLYKDYIQVGLCLPASCEAAEILHYTDSYFDEKIFKTQRDFNIKMNAIDIRLPRFDPEIFSSWSCRLLA